MSAIKTIRTHNIQSHKDVLIELPETGVVVFQGPNSNGKSVITKVIQDTVYNNISKLGTRKSLVNRDVAEGFLEIIRYDGSSLYVNINLEASKTYVKLTRANGEEVTRYLADKTIPDLVEEFGFHYNSDRGISLNICDSDESLLFFKTNHVTNGDILNSALTDNDVQRKYEALLNVNLEATNNRRVFAENLRVARAAKDAIVLYDIEQESKISEAVNYAAAVLSSVYTPDVKDIPTYCPLKFISIPNLRVATLAYTPIIHVTEPKLSSIKIPFEEFMMFKKGVCPACHRPLFSSFQTSISEM